MTSHFTRISEIPLIVTQEDYLNISRLVERVSMTLDQIKWNRVFKLLGVEEGYFYDCLNFDKLTSSEIIMGGVDLYRDKDSTWKILEVNSDAPQFLGLQDFRQQILGVTDQPNGVDHFIEFLHSNRIRRVWVIGTKTNPYWRGHVELCRKLTEKGFETRYGGAQDISKLLEEKFIPQLMVRFTGSRFLLYDPKAAPFREFISTSPIPMVNSLAAVFCGYRGVLEYLAEKLPDLFPAQTTVGPASEESLSEYPWIKIEVGGRKYVANFRGLRQWTREVLLAILRGNIPEAERILSGKQNTDSTLLCSLCGKINEVQLGSVRWVAQQHIEPSETEIVVNENKIAVKTLFRAYWIKLPTGGLRISLEAIGCDKEQYSKSKSKINAGSGIVIPVVIR